MNGTISAGIKANRSFFMQIVNRVVQKVAAVGFLFNMRNAVQINFNQLRGPQAINQHAFIHHPDAEMQHKTHHDRNQQDAKTYYQQQVAFALPLHRKKINGKTNDGQSQPDSDRDKFAAEVLLFCKSRFCVHITVLDSSKITTFLVPELTLYRSSNRKPATHTIS